MFQFHAKRLLPVLLTTLIGTGAYAQTSTVSNPTSTRENAPYSRFGLGEQIDGNGAALRGMADITSAYADPYTVNTDNPASYSFLTYTTFEAGATGSTRNLATTDYNYTTGTATLSYLNIAFPVGKHVGLCLGFRPETHVYYDLTDTAADLLGNQTARFYTGSGATDLAFVGVAYQYKGFSIGVNAGYLFGNINYTTQYENLDTSKSYNSNFITNNHIGGIYWKAGVLYQGKLNKDLMFRIGGTLQLEQQINQNRNEYWASSYIFADTTIADTAFSAPRQDGKVTLPTSYSLGIQLAKANSWDVGIDYTGTEWSQFRNFGQPDAALAASNYKIALGGDYIPNAENLRNYWSRVAYRFGLYYGTDNVYLNNTTLYEYGITLGASLPFRRSTSHLHASFDIGRLGTTANSMVQETYVRFTLGISFNDKWFIRRRYE